MVYHEKGTPLDEEDAYPYEDPWPYGFGDVIGCPTTPNGIDAADLFRRDLRENITYGGQYGLGGYAYVNLYTICFSSASDNCDSYEIPPLQLPADDYFQELYNDDDPYDNDNFYESPLFYNDSSDDNYHVCITDDEMNFHYNEMKDLAEDELGGPQVGSRYIAQVQVGYNFIAFGPTVINHSMHIYYANVLPVTTTPMELPSTCCN